VLGRPAGRIYLARSVLSAAITSASSSGNHKAKVTCVPYTAVALPADTKSTGRFFQVMTGSAIDKNAKRRKPIYGHYLLEQ
jgi:hypothetical protein